MDVLHLYSGNLFGGVERLLLTLASSAPHHRVALCFNGRLAEELRRAGRAPEMLGEVRVRRPWSILRARSSLSRLLRARRPGAVVCHSAWAHALFAGTVRAAGLPLGFFLHDLSSGSHWLDRAAARTVPDVVFANSPATAEAAARLFPGRGAELVTPPLAPRSGSVDRSGVRAAEGAAPGDGVVLLFSRPVPLKGHALLLEALALLPPGLSWRAWIAGGARSADEASYLASLRAQAAPLGNRVRFLGERADIPALLAAADVHCQPNTAPEAFGLAYAEAMQSGLPVVTTEWAARSGVVDASCAVLAAAEPRALADALERVLRDGALRDRLAEAGRRRVAAACDPGRFAAALEAALSRPPQVRRATSTTP